MNMNLLGTLGLDKVEADPNAIPDGKYDGEVYKSEYVLSENKDSISHVITYRVTEGQYKGAQRQSWNQLGKAPRDASGNFPKSPSDIVTYEPSMSEAQKSWYKKTFVDLGVPEDQVHTTPIESLVGKQITFGVKKNNGYVNVNFVELREPTTQGPDSGNAGSAPVGLGF